MLIDIHAHITYNGFSSFSKKINKRPFTVKTLLERMDKEGIDVSVVLPLINPENIDIFGVAGNRECIAAARKHPDRLISFCNIDPRACLNTHKADLSLLMRAFSDYGCKGIGEVCASLSITDPRYQNLFFHAGKEKMPILFHLTCKNRGTYGMIDKLHLPGLESTLRKFPDTIFIGHAPAFWNEIDGDIDMKLIDGYPSGPIKKKGRLCYLLEKYPNLYGDISAGSGHNALSRDPEFGYWFMRKFNRKLFFGTDRFRSKDVPEPAIISFLKNAYYKKEISRSVYENITNRNFRRVFDIDFV